jgi:hypothetical protein
MATFNTTVQLPEPPNVLESRLIASLLNIKELHVRAQPGSGIIVITRRHRPDWATALGVIGLLVFLIGILFFFVKVTESLTIAISPHGEGGSTVVINGEAAPWATARIHNALAQPAAAAPVVPANEIEQLGSLHSRGVLSDEEFQAAKQRVLSG